MVDRQTICDVFRGLRGAVESLKVKNQRSCTGQIERKFIDLVVENEVALILGQPSLVGVTPFAVAVSAQQHGLGLVRDIDHRDRIFIAGKADLVTPIALIRTLVDHAFDIMGVTVVAETAGKGGVERVSDIDHVQATAAGLTANRIGIARGLIDGDVVGLVELIIVRHGAEGHRRSDLDTQQFPEIEDLDAVTLNRIGHDEGVIAVGLHIRPDRIPDARWARQVSHIDRVFRIGHLDEGHAIGATHQGKKASAVRITPTPVVGSGAAADGRQLHPAGQIDAQTGKLIGHPVAALGRPVESIVHRLLHVHLMGHAGKVDIGVFDGQDFSPVRGKTGPDRQGQGNQQNQCCLHSV